MTEQTLRRRERKNAQTRQALATTQRSVSGEGLRPGQRQEITDAVDISVPTHH
jgi:hypothetical protein